MNDKDSPMWSLPTEIKSTTHLKAISFAQFEDPNVTVKCRTAITVLFLYLNCVYM